MEIKLRGPVNAHMFHMIGEIKPSWNNCEESLFCDKDKMLAIAHQKDNSYLLYSKSRTPDFNKYFFNYKILKHKFWEPAFHIEGNNCVDFIQGDNVYMIGDNNICGLEDNYIYGVYAANKILGKTKD